jgi:SET domain-containing protein
MPDVIVKSSSIHGRGLFAARAFKAGEVVVKWAHARLLTADELSRIPSSELPYLNRLSDGSVLLMGEPERYMNHSCRPNTKTSNDRCDIALRDIAAGEELTSDYTDSLLPNYSEPCRCGAPNCRGKIESSHKL